MESVNKFPIIVGVFNSADLNEANKFTSTYKDSSHRNLTFKKEGTISSTNNHYLYRINDQVVYHDCMITVPKIQGDKTVVTIECNDNQARISYTFKNENIEIIVNLYKGNFLETEEYYKNINNDTNFVVNSKEFISKLNDVKGSLPSYNGVKLTIKNNSIEFETQNFDTLSESISCCDATITNIEINTKIGFDFFYLKNILQIFKGSVKFLFNETKYVLIKQGNKEVLLMPKLLYDYQS